MLSNLHTHTKFCDGSNTAEELVEEAIDKGFVSLGFSAHAYHTAKGSLTAFEVNFMVSSDTNSAVASNASKSFPAMTNASAEEFLSSF